MNSALTTSRTGYYKTTIQYYKNPYKGEITTQYGNGTGKIIVEGGYATKQYTCKGGTASFSLSSIPAGSRGNKTVNVS